MPVRHGEISFLSGGSAFLRKVVCRSCCSLELRQTPRHVSRPFSSSSSYGQVRHADETQQFRIPCPGCNGMREMSVNMPAGTGRALGQWRPPAPIAISYSPYGTTVQPRNPVKPSGYFRLGISFPLSWSTTFIESLTLPRSSNPMSLTLTC